MVKPGEEYRRCWAGAERDVTSVTTRGRIQGDIVILRLLLSRRVSRLLMFWLQDSGIDCVDLVTTQEWLKLPQRTTESEEGKN